MKNIIAVVVLIALGAVAFFLFREKPDTEQQATAQAIKPIDITKLDEIRIKRHEGLGDKRKDESYTLKKEDGKWRMVAPVDYSVVETSVDSMTKTLSELHVIDIISEKSSSHGKFDVDDKSGIDMVALSGKTEMLHVIVGASSNGVTFMRYPGKNEVYRMKGSFKFNFDRSIKSLREKTIVKTDIETLKTATFGQGEDALVLEKTGTGKDLSVKPVGKEIKNFDAPKALGVVRTLVNLNAVDFVDEALTEEVTGFGPNAFTAAVDAIKDNKPYQVTVTIGNKTADKAQMYAKNSVSDQVFLIAEFTANRLKAKAEDFIKKEEEKKPAGKNPAGMNPGGMNPMGMKPGGMKPGGMNPMGMKPAN